MAFAVMIDEFDGSPQELYDLVTEEVKKREIPGAKVKADHEFRSKGWFSAGESAPSLSIGDDTHRVELLAYQFGRSFHVSTRAYWQKVKMAEKEREDKLWFLEEVRSGAFSETIDRAVRKALVRHLEKRNAPVPANLDPKDVFYKRDAQTGEVGG